MLVVKRAFMFAVFCGLIAALVFSAPLQAQNGTVPTAPTSGEQIYLPMISGSPAGMVQAAVVNACASTGIFINEFHYDNTGGDTGEFVEVAGPAGTNLTDWSIVPYNGNNGANYSPVGNLSGLIPDEGSGYGAVSVNITGLQNGAPDGMALVNGSGTVVQFLSYEGSFTATAGPANGQTSTDVGVFEGGSDPIGNSLQLTGTGTCPEDFTWSGPSAESPGSINSGQTFGAAADTPPAVSGASPADAATNVPVNATITVNFNEAVDLTASAFTLACPTGTPVSFTAALPANDVTSITLTPDADLPDSTTCTVTVVATEVTDNDGTVDAMAADYVFSFDTAVPLTMSKVHDVQGSGTSVTAPSSTVMVQAVVVGDYQAFGQLGGFFIQEENVDVDADPATSEGIFIYCGSCPVDVAVGDLVTVTGSESEYFNMSQISATGGTDIVIESSSNPLPTPATLDLPLADADREPFEGMLVTIPDVLTVAEYYNLERYGQVTLNEGGRIEQFTNANAPDATNYAAHLADKAERTIILDDDNNIQNAPLNFGDPLLDKAIYYPTPGGFSTTNYFRGGYTITGLTGVLHWSFAGQSGTDAWRIRPVTEAYSYAFTPANPRPAAPAVGGNIHVASMNVLNYFNGDGLGGGFPTSRGANSVNEFTRQTDKIVAALAELDADVVGLMEIENDFADGSNSAIAGLVDALNAVVGAGTYAYIDPNPGSNIGSDGIAVGMIYKPAVVGLVGTTAVLDGPTFTDPNNTGTDKNRPALAQAFRIVDTANSGEGEIFTVAVNHLKSKGSSCGAGDDDTTTGQGNCNVTRALAAAKLADWLANDDPTGTGDPDALIIGDLNAYAKEDPITALTGAGYTDLIDLYTAGDGYSYVFDGEIGYLDHALANATLAPQVVGAHHWNINADEAGALDYNDSIQDGGEANSDRRTTVNDLYDPDQYRSSDHDPVLIGLGLYPDRGDSTFAGYGEARHNGQGYTLRLGTEWSGEETAAADTNDGVGSVPDYDDSGTYSISVQVVNNGDAPAQIAAWLDTDGSGTFGDVAMERSSPDVTGTCANGSGASDATYITGNVAANCSGEVVLTWSGLPTTISVTPIPLRIRLTTDAGTYGDANFFSDSSPQPTGLALDGEVEDYSVNITLAVSLAYAAATRDGATVHYFWQMATETSNAGFNVLAVTDEGVIALNQTLIASEVIDTVTPVNYSFAAVTDVNEYYIETVGINGARTRYGPYQVGVEYGAYSLPGDIDLQPGIWLPLIIR
ncbi:MAG: ExeM/NucH family extracellular endonuclease [Caldilineaceae bacterium]|nr:ExeM/NucH family extracellular endonuclease [Caldilineaceae bacterium]